MRPLFGPRTVLEAAVLVAVPILTLEIGGAWYTIAAAGAVAYVLVLIVEVVLWRQARRALPPLPPEPLTEEVVARPPAQRVVRPAPELEPEPEPMPAPPPAPPPEPELPPAATGPRRWNMTDLERLVREHSGRDPIADEQRTFLLVYLRDFAGPDGLLPVDFDDLVRQSFGELIADG
jgi:hypothetical protein